MKRIKLTFMDCKYSIHEEQGVVVAKSTFKLVDKKFTTTGIARCNPAIFDIKAGKQLARARAEKKAYIIARNIIKDFIHKEATIVEILNNSLDFFSECIEHQDNYIQTF